MSGESLRIARDGTRGLALGCLLGFLLGCMPEDRVAVRRRHLERALRASPVVAECWRRSVSRAPDHPSEALRVTVSVDTHGHVTATRVEGARDYRLVPCLRADLPTIDLGEGLAQTVTVTLVLRRAGR